MSDEKLTPGGLKSTQRRSQRVILHLAITVRSQDAPPDNSFEEETQTLVVSAHGALIALEAKVEKDQTLLITNRATQTEQLCRVKYLGPASGGKTQIGVEFLNPSPDFWRIVFPPDNSVALNRASEDVSNYRTEK
ncbi:MAG TPA: PilZ domain-containing protein [Candidatus Dormibacteraeota bacterium]|nr:PilZ domain-containing protein [Candidatus Dormibacteraeota bacterium]